MQINSEGVFIFFDSADAGSFPVKDLYLLRAFLEGFRIRTFGIFARRSSRALPLP